MSEIIYRTPRRPLVWSDVVLDLADIVATRHESVYIVGGAVRDAYLHHPTKDLDLTTDGSASQLGRFIANQLSGDFYVLDAERDVARVLLDFPMHGRLVIDLAGFRGDTLLADLQDRDFTLNAMAVDLKGDLSLLIDPLNGENDLSGRVLKRCSDHAIADDPIRALRAVRQSVQFNARIHTDTLADIRKLATTLNNTSPERIRDEFFKLLALNKPVRALRVADAVGLLAEILPETQPLKQLMLNTPQGVDSWQHTLAVVDKLHAILMTISPKRTTETAAAFDLGMIVMTLDRYRPQLQAHIASQWVEGRSHWALLLLVALLHEAGKPGVSHESTWEHDTFHGFERAGKVIASERVDALRLSNDEKQRVTQVIQAQMMPVQLDVTSRVELHRFWHRLGVSGVDVCLLAMAEYLGTHGVAVNQDAWLAFLEKINTILDVYFNQYERVVAPPPVIDGTVLMDSLGLKAGALIGELLTIIREAQVEDKVKTLEDALRVARRHIDGQQE